MLWLLVAILAYFIFAIVALIDKFLLEEKIPNPRVYIFYVGTLGILSLFLIPFGFYVPKIEIIFKSFFAGAIFIFALFYYYSALKIFEASRIIPAIGAFLPIFTFFFALLTLKGKENLSLLDFFAFLFLVFGSVLISTERKKIGDFKGFQFAILVAFLSALALVLTKSVYDDFRNFWSAFIWMRIGGFLFAIFFLLSPEVKKEIFQKRITFQKKTMVTFLSNQALGASGFILQNWAIALAPLIYLPVINALQGIQYVFLFIFATLLSLKFPQILKEKISKEIILQKILAILLIGTGLVLFILK